MFRGLIILVAIVIIYLLAKRLLGQKTASSNIPTPTSENMLQCSECGSFTPQNETIIDGEQCFCCKQHQQDWQSRQ